MTARRALLVFVLAAAVTGGLVLGRRSAALERYGDLPDFRMQAVTAEGTRITTRADLTGRVWIAGFVFTRCGGPCPLVMAKMAALQSRLPAGVGLLTVSVDPDHDTPAVLRRYAARWGARPAAWLFLRGDATQVRNLVYEGFHESVYEDRAAPAPFRMVHSTRLALVDRTGRVRAYYDTQRPSGLDGILRDAAALAREA